VLTISDVQEYDVGVADLGGGSDSPKAWMTVRDADILEEAFGAVARRAGGNPRFLEWGSGLSTLYYTKVLRDHCDQFLWVTMEHDRAFFSDRVAKYLSLWSDSKIVFVDSNDQLTTELADPAQLRGVVALVYNGGTLTPFKPGFLEHREVNLDEFVSGPAQLGMKFDAIFVDGRKRRRCLLEASQLVAEGGIVLLHDAERPYYQCAWSSYRYGQRIGDELWIAAQQPTDFREFVSDEALTGPGFAYDPDEYA
jgi:hypothetical protein